METKDELTESEELDEKSGAQPEKNPLNAKKIALFVVYGLVAALLLITVLSFNDLPKIFEQLKTVDYTCVLYAILFILAYLFTYPLSLCILTKAHGTRISFSTTYSIAMTEHFFNGITPLATGGQPFQAHSYSRAKVSISESTGLLLTNLLIYMAVTTGFSLTGLFFFDTLTANIDRGWIPVIIIGYTLNFMVLVTIVFLGVSTKLRRGLMKCIYFFAKFRLFRFLNSKAEGIEEYFVSVQAAFGELVRKKGHFALAFLTKIISFAFFYASTYFILMAMGVAVSLSNMFMILAGTSFAITAVGFIPTPGASGGVEGSAGQVFKCIIIYLSPALAAVAPAMANGVMLIWRLISYYFVMAISLAFYIGLEFYFAKKNKK